MNVREYFPEALWVTGEGDFACVSDCPPGMTVMLFKTLEEAEEAMRTIDESGCGGRCKKRHRILPVSRP
jgi:hypothetical protein